MATMRLLNQLGWSKRHFLALASILFTAGPLFLIRTLPSGDASERGLQELRSLVASSSPNLKQDLLTIEFKYPHTRAGALARFLRGYLLFSEQNYTAAREALDANQIGKHSSLGDYALFYRAESSFSLGDYSAARRDFAAMPAQYPDSLLARRASLRAAEMAILLGQYELAARELSRKAELKDADAMLLLARANEKMGKSDLALQLKSKIYYEHPATRASAEIESEIPKPGPFQQERARAHALFEAAAYEEAARAYQALIERFPESSRSDEILLRLGASLLNAGQTTPAIKYLSEVSRSDSQLYCQALFHLAEALSRAGQLSPSAAIVDRLLAQARDTAWAQKALYNLARHLDQRGDLAKATMRWRQLLEYYPAGQYAPEASYVLGWRAYQAGKYSEAAQLLERHLASFRYPQSKFLGEAGFWAARAEEKLGHRSRALALYELISKRYRYGYHGIISERRRALLLAANPKLEPEKNWPELEVISKNLLYVEPIKETADGSEAPRIARADELELLGLTDLAIREMNQALENAPSSPKLNLKLAQIYYRRGDNFQATIVPISRKKPGRYSSPCATGKLSKKKLAASK
jgi:TolA-binding protein